MRSFFCALLTGLWFIGGMPLAGVADDAVAAVPEDMPDKVVRSGDDGALLLLPEDASIKGAELKEDDGKKYAAGMKDENGKITWRVNVARDGAYSIEMNYASPDLDMIDGRNHTWAKLIVDGKAVGYEFPNTGGEFKNRKEATLPLKKGERVISLEWGRGEFDLALFKLVPTRPHKVDNEDAPACEPDGDGIIYAGIEKARRIHSSMVHEYGIYSTNDWNYEESRVSWTVAAPKAGKYAVELTWANNEPKRTVDFDLNGKTVFQWKIKKTGGWRTDGKYFSERVGELDLPEGKSEFEIYIPDASQKGNMDFRCIRLIPIEGLQERVSAIRQKPRLGLNLEELKYLWGMPMPGITYDLAREGSKNDIDAKVFADLSKYCECYRWFKDGLIITAALLENRCIAIAIVAEDKTLDSAEELTRTLLTGVDLGAFEDQSEDIHTEYLNGGAYKFQYWGDSFEIKASAVAKDYIAQKQHLVDELQIRPRTGMTLAELQELWGKGETRTDIPFGKSPKGAADRDSDLYKDLARAAKGYRWKPRDVNAESISAFFWNGRCIVIDIWKQGSYTAKECVEWAQKLIPGIEFDEYPGSREFVIYSSNMDQRYKLRCWGDYFELMDSGLVREMKREHLAEIKSEGIALAGKLAKNPDMGDSGLLGMTRSQMDAILGQSVELEEQWCKRPSVKWSFGDRGDLGIIASFEEGECANITIIDEQKRLNNVVAVYLARRMVGSVEFPRISSQGYKGFFKYNSLDKKKRYVLEWYNDPKVSGALRITDSKAGKKDEVEKEKAVAPKSSPGLLREAVDTIRKQLF